MHVLYEDNGTLKAQTVFSQADTTLQVESASGKRSKIKQSAVVFTFDAPDPARLLPQAQTLADTLDVPFLWECAPQEEFAVEALGAEYFGHAPDAVEKTALILALGSAPAYFHRRGKGRYRPAPPDILTAALAAIEKKRLQAEQQQRWTQAMIQGELPAEIAPLAPAFLLKPDKNTLAYKAFDAAVTQLNTTPERLLLTLKVWPHALALHRDRFFAQIFPQGYAHPSVSAPPLPDNLALAEVEAYSVDDDSTTEIDDAISVTTLAGDQVRVGIHIAAPGLGITRASDLDQIARARMSTVYLPGQKITMLPTELVDAYTLNANVERPCLSLYIHANLASGELLGNETRIERIRVRENLRLGQLDTCVTQAALDDPESSLPYGHWLRPLWRLTQHLSARREQVRGKPEGNNRIEYSFMLDGAPDDPATPVQIVPRRRDDPVGRIVSEMMILANHQWGMLLAQHGVPGIYRSQQTGRVRMSTQALPHEAIGVSCYAWCTSPLRRYVDLVNQWQLLAAAEHGVSARLVAPFKPKDADLYAIISAFDTQYAAVNDFQSAMERFWCLRWLQQQGMTTVQGNVLRDDLVRLDCAPLVVRVHAMPALERGQVVTLEVTGVDELALELHCRYLMAHTP